MQVGTYNVNSDCSITLSLTDVFGSNTTPVQLVGVVLGGGTEIDCLRRLPANPVAPPEQQVLALVRPDQPAQAAPSPAPPLVIKLTKVLYRNFCSAANLQGTYGFVLNTVEAGSGTGTSTTTGTTGTGTSGNAAANPSL
jgi:hypothetical protein